MAQFRPKKLDLGCFVNIMNIRDHTKRKVFEQHEPERYASSLTRVAHHRAHSPDEVKQSHTDWMNLNRQALRYVIRNTSLPQRTRAQAQLQLTQMHCYTRPTQIKNRCIMGAKGRGVLRDFRMARVSHGDGHRSE
jgi:small subunit ribosomal protein S14